MHAHEPKHPFDAGDWPIRSMSATPAVRCVEHPDDSSGRRIRTEHACLDKDICLAHPVIEPKGGGMRSNIQREICSGRVTSGSSSDSADRMRITARKSTGWVDTTGFKENGAKIP